MRVPTSRITKMSTVTIAVLLMAACGSDDDSTDVSIADGSGATVAVPEPTAATVAPTVSAATEATDPATSNPSPDGDVAAFCEAAEEYYVYAAAAIEYVETGAGFGALVPTMVELGEQTVTAAPDEALAEGPTNALDALRVLDASLAEVDYDGERIGEIADQVALDEAFTTVDEEYLNIESVLADTCESDLGELDDRSLEIAESADAAAGS